MFFVIWIYPVRDSQQSSIDPWPMQLAFHGVMIVMLVGGFALSVPRISLFGWQRATWQAGAGLVAVGFVTCLGLAVVGLVMVGAVEFLSRQHRAAGTALVIGPLSWLTVWLRGARFDSEDSLPLDALERLLSTAGLGLICAGIVAPGVSRVGERHS